MILFLIAFASVSSVSSAGGSPAKPSVASQSLPAALLKVEKKYKQSKSFYAEFVQDTKVRSTGSTKKSSGKIWILRPDKVKWQTIEPDPSLTVGNGKTLWIYTPPFDEESPGSVTIGDAKKRRSGLLDALLSGSFSMAKGMDIKMIRNNVFELLPSKKKSIDGIRKAIVWIDPQSSTINKVQIHNVGGNLSDIKLSKIDFSKILSKNFFNFQIPPNTEQHRLDTDNSASKKSQQKSQNPSTVRSQNLPNN